MSGGGSLGSKLLKVACTTLTVAIEVTAAAAATTGAVAVIGLMAGMTEAEEATAVAADGLSTFLIMACLTLGVYALGKYLSSMTISNQVDTPTPSSTQIIACLETPTFTFPKVKAPHMELPQTHVFNQNKHTLKWSKPEVGWFKLNIDGSLDHVTIPRTAGCGGVLRDASGKWIFGFSKKLDPSCNVHDTEIAAILKGLELASDMNIRRLVVESDNESVVSMVENETRPNHPQYSRIRRLRYDPKWEVKVVHIRRGKANQVADRLANDARVLRDECLREYPCPPSNCISLVKEDARLG